MEVVIGTMAPILAIVAVGYLIEGRSPIEMSSLSQLALLVCSPCLVFGRLAGDHGTVTEGLAIVGACLFVMLATGMVGAAGLSLLPGRPRGLILPIVFWNAGALGLSVARFARGEAGMEIATLVFVTVAATQAILSSWIATGRGGGRQVLRMPIAWAAILGLSCSFLDLEPPRILMDPVRLLGDAAIPLLLLVLGMQLHRLELKSPLPALYASFMRIVVGFLAALLFVELVGLRGLGRDIVLIESVMPPAIISLVFAQRFEADPEEVGSAIVGATLASFLAIPLVIAAL